MGKVIAFAHTKGGVGKSTLACQIAVLGSEVLLVDADPQATTTLFAAARKEAGREGITAIQLSGKTVHKDLKQLAAKHELVIVDVGGRDSMTLRSVLIAADLAVIPVAPRGPELWATDDIAKVIEEVRTVNEGLRGVLVINRADPKRGFGSAGRVQEAQRYLKDIEGLELLPCAVGNRITFTDAVTLGLGVREMKEVDSKAVEEIQCLYDTLTVTVREEHGTPKVLAS